jgi:hypothetical protein
LWLPKGTAGPDCAGLPTVRLSRLGPPLAVVAVTRILLLPAVRGALTVLVCQVSQLPVAGKETSVAAAVPLTEMSIGRLVVVPLA